MADAPIFVVGAPRSGTTLLASMLAGHPRIACGPETHFFNKLSPGHLRAALADRAWPDRAVQLVLSLTLAGQAVTELFGHSERDLREFLAAREPSTGALLESLTALHARKRGKARWAEKTPNHLLHLPAIRRHYPGAPVVRIVRDPRDSALSMRQLPWASPSALANAHLWSAWFSASQPFFRSDARSFTVRYEDLVHEPEGVLTAVCGFIGEVFEPGMLEFTQTATDVSSPKETWKAGNARTLDAGRTERWRQEPDPTLRRALSYTCREGIGAFGYPCAETPKATVRAHPLGPRTAEAHESTLLRAAAQETQFCEAERPSTEAGLVFLPAEGGPRRTRLKTLGAAATLLCSRRAAGLSTYYLRPGHVGWTGYLTLALCRLLAEPYAPVRPHAAPSAAGPNPAPTSPNRPAAPRPPPPRSHSDRGRSAAQ